jgi:small subunit ribosomal protein S16
MLTIRLTRKGKKNQPFFRVVLIDKRRSTKGGRSVEDLGYVDPLKKRRSFNKERIQYWISKGAQTSATIHNLLVSEKIIEAEKIHVSRLSKKKLAEINAKKSAEPTKVEKPAEPTQSPSDNEAGRESAPAEPAPVEEEKPAE